MLTAQTNLAGRYQIVQAIGSGGFGQTYLAKDLHLPNHPLCVVKQFRPHPDQGATIEKLLELFDKEAKALYNLGNHDCIPRLLAHFNEGSEFYLAQEYIEGHTLTDELVSMTKMHESYVINLLKDILEVLTFVHQNNVIHRDIKPSNLIRRKTDGKIVLIDFGAVKEVSRGKSQTGMTSVSIAIGSYGYMPDEQAANKPRYASDIYAVGKIAIQALTGMRPDQMSDDPATGELVWKHHAQVSPQLGAVIDRMVRSHFRDRYADAAEALTALQSLTSENLAPNTSNYFAPTVISQPEQSPTQTGLISSNNDAVTLGIPISPNVARTVAAQNFAKPVHTEVNSSAAKTVISDSNPTYVVTTNPPLPNSFNWNLWLSLAGIASIGLAGFGAYTWMRDRDFQNAISEAKSFQSKANYDACWDKLTLIPKDATQANEAKSLSISCQSLQAKDKLTSAKGLAKDGKYQEAIAIANTISAETPSYADAQTEVSKWSDSLLVKATDLYSKEGKLEQAVEMAQKIPAKTSAGKKAADLIPKWQSAWTNSEANYKEATAASKKEDWKKVVDASKQVADTPYWNQKVAPLRKQAETQIALINAPISAPVNIPETPIAATNQAVYTPPEPTYAAPTYVAPVYTPPEPVYTAPAPPPEPVYVPPAPASNACSSRNC